MGENFSLHLKPLLFPSFPLLEPRSSSLFACIGGVKEQVAQLEGP